MFTYLCIPTASTSSTGAALSCSKFSIPAAESSSPVFLPTPEKTRHFKKGFFEKNNTITTQQNLEMSLPACLLYHLSRKSRTQDFNKYRVSQINAV